MESKTKGSERSDSVNNFRIGANYFVYPFLNQIVIKGLDGNGKTSRTARIEPRVMQVLTLLAEHPSEVLSRQFLIDRVWENRFVGEEALTQAISRLRKVFEDNAHQPQFIETISKKGYRLIACIDQNSDIKITNGLEPQVNRASKVQFFKTLALSVFVLSSLTAAISISYRLFDEDNHLFQKSPLLNAVPITSEPGLELMPSLSPQGNFLAYTQFDTVNNSFDIFIKSTTHDEIRRVTNDNKDNMNPVWSPDGHFILFSRHADGKSDICLTSFSGGEVKRIVSCGLETKPTFTWAPDGKQIIISDRVTRSEPYRIYSFNLDSQERQLLSLPDVSFYGDITPVVSTDGKTLAFKRMYTPSTGDIYTSDLEIGQMKKVTNLAKWIGGLSWFDADHLLYASVEGSYSSLWKISSQGGAATWLGGKNLYELTTSMDGNTLAFSQAQQNIDIWTVEIPQETDSASVPMEIVTSTQTDWAPSISPDGTKMAYISDQSGYSEIWICERDGLNKKQITFLNEQVIGNLSWSPDGSTIAFTIVENGKYAIFHVPSTGGLPSVFIRDQFNNRLPTWSANGNYIHFTSDRKDGQQIWKKSIDSKFLKQITTYGALYAVEASNGFLYLTRPDRCGLWRMPSHGGEPELVLSKVQNEDYKNWVVNSQGIYFIERLRSPVPAISFFDQNTQEVIPILSLKEPWKYYRLNISADRNNQWLYYTVVARVESDIMLVRL